VSIIEITRLVLTRLAPASPGPTADDELVGEPVLRRADVLPLVRSQIYLARALAFDPAILVLEHPTANLSVEDAKAFAAIVSAVAARRGLTTVGLLMDEKFAKATGGRLLTWQPATGEMKERSSLRFW